MAGRRRARNAIRLARLPSSKRNPTRTLRPGTTTTRRPKLLSVLGSELPRLTDDDAMPAIYFAGHGQTETLAGGADFDRDGFVTTSEIGTDVRPQVTMASKRRQTPQFGTLEGAGEVAFDVLLEGETSR